MSSSGSNQIGEHCAKSARAIRRLFISAVSTEFLTYRTALSERLSGMMIEIIVQEDFKPLGEDTLHLLEEYISTCDDIIHIVGDSTGDKPPYESVQRLLERIQTYASDAPMPAFFTLPSNSELTYTQWEAWLAIFFKKKLWVCCPSSEAKRD